MFGPRLGVPGEDDVCLPQALNLAWYRAGRPVRRREGLFP